MRNSLSLDDVRKMTPREIADLSVEELAMLLEELEVENERLKGVKENLDGGVSEKYSQRAASARGDDFGTAHIIDGEYDVKSVVGKKVEWDQKKLKAAWDLVESWGENPSEYINTKYEISEAAYKNWPSKLQSVFAGARTVKPTKEKFTIERKD